MKNKYKPYPKTFTEIFYRIICLICKKYTTKHFDPIVLGEKNIPRDKCACVFIGNHRNKRDPLVTIASLRFPTHFVALKRMFDFNEIIFGNVGKNWEIVLTALFVRFIGALPIAHPTDNYRIINLHTFKYVKKYLNGNSAIAIYPEGTLNSNPNEDGNILPLKSIASFQFAENGRAVICPVAIVWGSEVLGLKNKVIISFLQPINTDNLKGSEISKIWSEQINSSISSINKIYEEMIKASNALSSVNYSNAFLFNKRNHN